MLRLRDHPPLLFHPFRFLLLSRLVYELFECSLYSFFLFFFFFFFFVKILLFWERYFRVGFSFSFYRFWSWKNEMWYKLVLHVYLCGKIGKLGNFMRATFRGYKSCKIFMCSAYRVSNIIMNDEDESIEKWGYYFGYFYILARYMRGFLLPWIWKFENVQTCYTWIKYLVVSKFDD